MVSLYLILLLPFSFYTFIGATAFTNNVDKTNQTALVLGASVSCRWKVNILECKPANILKNRLDKSIELYNTRQVKKILVSGNGDAPYYDETKVMTNYLVAHKIKPLDIISDYTGNSTLESCENAKSRYHLGRLLIVTQAFHLSRSIFLCHALGLEVSASIAEDSSRESQIYGILREIPASWKALFEVLENSVNLG